LLAFLSQLIEGIVRHTSNRVKFIAEMLLIPAAKSVQRNCGITRSAKLQGAGDLVGPVLGVPIRTGDSVAA
jgi:hypothetical protein